MTAALITAAASGSLLIACVMLFRFEHTRGTRVFQSARETFDAWVVQCTVRFARMQLHLGTGAMRVAFHRMMHALFLRLVRITDLLAGYFDQLRERNHRIARSVRENQEKTYLGLIAEHKEQNALSDDEQQELKRRSLEGDAH